MKIKIAHTEENWKPMHRHVIFALLLIALLINAFPWSGWALSLRPDFVAVLLLHTYIRGPSNFGFMTAWVFGLLMDITEGSLLGQHAATYVVLVYLVLHLSRRLQALNMQLQILYILPVLLGSQLVTLAIRLVSGADFPGWIYFLPSITGAAIWPLVYIRLKVPRRRKRNFD